MKRTAAIIAFVAIAMLAACSNMNMGMNPPSNLMAEALDGGAHLTWKDNSDNESQFMIERKAGNGDWTIVGMVPFDTTQYHDPNLTPGTTYVYRVMAMPKEGGHDGGSNAYSAEVTFTAPAAGTPTDGGTDGSADGPHHGA